MTSRARPATLAVVSSGPSRTAVSLLAAVLFVSLPTPPAAAQIKSPAPGWESSAPRVRVELISEHSGIAPGASFWVGLRQRIAPGWHTYWLNPGDSGEPTTIEWALPPGFEAGEIAWPHPARIPVGPAMSYGYTSEVVLLTQITAPAALEPGTRLTLRGHATWLVCEKICIPEEARVELTLPVVTGRSPVDRLSAAAIERTRRAVPAPSPWPASFSATPEEVSLTVAAPGLAPDRIADVWFYPARWGSIDHAAPQAVRVDERAITVRAARGALAAGAETTLDGVLVITERLDQGPTSQAFVLRATRAPLRASGAGPLPSLPAALGLALAGGLILNLMPCVLPVLSVKALALVTHSSAGAAMLRWHGLAYTAGVLASFGVAAGALLALRAGGAQIGWGFQLQSPLFVTALAYVLFVLALSLSGVVLIGGGLSRVGHALASRPGYAGSFLTGALATVAATPCTAPFMGAAVGFALTQPAATALLVFEALGLGLAMPYLLLTLVPGWRRFLPRPGPWMDRLKQLLAFPLYASVVWLVWVVSRQIGPEGVAAVLTGLLLIGFAGWLHQATRAAGRPWRHLATGSAALMVGAAVALGQVVSAGPPSPGSSLTPDPGSVAWEPFSPPRLAELRAQGTPVFVNFTAAWCITCLVNERVALRSQAVAKAFARKGVVYLKADWTSRDAAITEILGAFGRSGVPLYVVFPPMRPGQSTGAEPLVLPQILSEGAIIEAVEKI